MKMRIIPFIVLMASIMTAIQCTKDEIETSTSPSKKSKSILFTINTPPFTDEQKQKIYQNLIGTYHGAINDRDVEVNIRSKTTISASINIFMGIKKEESTTYAITFFNDKEPILSFQVQGVEYYYYIKLSPNQQNQVIGLAPGPLKDIRSSFFKKNPGVPKYLIYAFQNLIGKYQGRFMDITPMTVEIKSNDKINLNLTWVLNNRVKYDDMVSYEEKEISVKYNNQHYTFYQQKSSPNNDEVIGLSFFNAFEFREYSSLYNNSVCCDDSYKKFTPEEESRLRNDLIEKQMYMSLANGMRALIAIIDDSNLIMQIDGIESAYTYTVDFSEESPLLILEKNGVTYNYKIRYTVKDCEKEPCKFTYDRISRIIYSDFYLKKM